MSGDMFSIKEDIFGGLNRIRFFNEHTKEGFSIIPAKGAIVQELLLHKNNKIFNVIDGPSHDEISKNPWFKSCILFPFPGRVRDGKYSFEGIDYQLNINEKNFNNSIHGLIHDQIFEVLNIISTVDEISIELNLQSDENIFTGFPFAFDFTIKYILTTSGEFKLKIKVLNSGTSNFPFGFGWHPYFQLNDSIGMMGLTLASHNFEVLDKRNLPTGEIKKLDGFSNIDSLIKKTELDTGFIQKKEETIASTKLYCHIEKVGLEIIQNVGEGLVFTQIYTPPHKKSIAIEPQTCGADSLNTKQNIIILSPNQEWNGNISVKIF